MSLRDQLLKSGLASKQQAKKAERESKKRQHQDLQAKKDALPDTSVQDELAKEISRKLEEQRQADRERNQQLEHERQQKEAHARAVDLMVHNDLSEGRAAIAYY